MIIHLNNRVEKATGYSSIPWSDLLTEFRRIYKLTGTQEILAVEPSEDGLTLIIKEHATGRDDKETGSSSG